MNERILKCLESLPTDGWVFNDLFGKAVIRRCNFCPLQVFTGVSSLYVSRSYEIGLEPGDGALVMNAADNVPFKRHQEEVDEIRAWMIEHWGLA